MRIVVPSSDRTLWLLKGFFYLLDKYWPGHPAVVVGGYTVPTFSIPEYAEFYRIGEFADYPYNKWSDGLIRLLEYVTDEIMVIHFDDFWLTRPVDDTAVRLLYDHLLTNPHLARIDLTSDRAKSGYAEPAGELGHLQLVSTPPITPYMLSFQTGLWRRSALVQYLKPGETAAESEIRGSHRMTQANANVLGTLNEPVRYQIVCQHGQLHFHDTGYQASEHQLSADDLRELGELGYLIAPEGMTT